MMNTASTTDTAATRFVRVAEGEANGYDDSDGFITYVDLEEKKVVTDHWTTRGYCPTPVRKYKEFNECTPEEQAAAQAIAVDYIIANTNPNASQCHELSDSYPIAKFTGIPCGVGEGRKFRGEGKLVEIVAKESCYWCYGRHRRNVTYTAIIQTPDGETHEANADYVMLDADLKPVIQAYWRSLLNDEGYKNLPFGHYSRDPWMSDYILKYYKA